MSLTPPDLAPLHLGLSSDGAVLTLRFDHGKVNEVGRDVLEALEQLTAWLHATPTVRALVTYATKVTSKGTPIFVPGADVTERNGWSDEDVIAHVEWQREVLGGLAALPLFHGVVVGGTALGWGTEYLLTADYVLGAPGAAFGLPETGLGIVPGAWGTARLWQRIGANQAKRLGMTGETIGLDEALRIGLCDEAAADHDAALARAMELAERAVTRSPTAAAAFKGAVDQAQASPSRAERAERSAYRWCVGTGEAARGRAAFAQIRQGKAPSWGPRRPVPSQDDGEAG